MIERFDKVYVIWETYCDNSGSDIIAVCKNKEMAEKYMETFCSHGDTMKEYKLSEVVYFD